MAMFYASWTGHVAPTSGTLKRAVFSFTFTVAASTSANWIAILDALWAGHVASSSSATKRAPSSITDTVASTSAGYAVW